MSELNRKALVADVVAKCGVDAAKAKKASTRRLLRWLESATPETAPAPVIPPECRRKKRSPISIFVRETIHQGAATKDEIIAEGIEKGFARHLVRVAVNRAMSPELTPYKKLAVADDAGRLTFA